MVLFERFLCVFVLCISVKTFFYNFFLLFFLWKTDKYFVVTGEDLFFFNGKCFPKCREWVFVHFHFLLVEFAVVLSSTAHNSGHP